MAAVAFAVVAAALGITGAAVALLDPGPTTEGPGALVAIGAIAGASGLVAVATRLLTLVVLKRIRNDGV